LTAKTTSKVIGTQTAFVNIRVHPGLSSPVKGRIQRNQRVEVGDAKAEADGLTWVFVDTGTASGYIALTHNVRLYDPVKDDMFHYLFGLEGKSLVHTLKTSWAGDGEMIQVDNEGGNYYLTKGHGMVDCNFEAFFVNDNGIYRIYDTSPGPNPKDDQQRPLVYIIDKGNVQPWLRRYMQEGERVNYNVYIDWKFKDSGKPYPGLEHVFFPHIIELKKIHASFTFPSGITLSDVAEFRSSFTDGQEFESYFYARGRGLVAWKDSTGSGRESYISAFIQGTPTLTRETIPWLTTVPREAVKYQKWDSAPVPVAKPVNPDMTQVLEQVENIANAVARLDETLKALSRK